MLVGTSGNVSTGGNCSLGHVSCSADEGIRALKDHLERQPDPWRQVGRRLVVEAEPQREHCSAETTRLGAPARWFTGHALHVPLPRAPSLKVACAYGVGIEAERAYYLRASPDGTPHDANASSPSAGGTLPCTGVECVRMDPITAYPPQLPAHLQMDVSHNGAPPAPDPGSTYPRVSRLSQGIQYVDGDGTVPLLSLGGACARAWQPTPEGTPLNPAGVSVVLREYEHRTDGEATSEVPGAAWRGGGAASDHVSILINRELHRDLLLVAAGLPMSRRVVSSIDRLAASAPGLSPHASVASVHF